MAWLSSRNIGRFSNQFSLSAKASFGERFSIGARSYSSTPLYQIKDLPSAAISHTAFRRAVKLSAHVFLVWWTYNFHADDLRQKYANWKAERNVQAMLKEMESKKHESAKAYLVALEREFNALKAKLSKRDDLEFEPSDRDLFESAEADLNIVEREIDAIKAKQHERGNKGKVRKEV